MLRDALRLHFDLALHYHDVHALFRVFVNKLDEGNTHAVVEEIKDWYKVWVRPGDRCRWSQLGTTGACGGGGGSAFLPPLDPPKRLG